MQVMSASTKGTLGSAYARQRNSLNFLRLTLALVVLGTHTVAIGGFHTISSVNGTTFGQIAVFGFFGISGYLITGSALRNHLGRYLWQRFLRIFPGFWICLAMTALFFGVIGWLSQAHPHCGWDCYFNASRNNPFDYVYRNSLLKINQASISGTPRNVPLPLIWDQSLWTLFYEFICYLLLAGLALIGFLRHRVWTLLGTVLLWGVVTAVTLTPRWNAQFNLFQNWSLMNILKFSVVFMVGAVIYLYRDRIPDSGWLALACAGLFIASLWLPTGGQVPDFKFTSSFLLAPLVAYPLLWLGIHLPFQAVGAENDYSYGVYIYAWPASQLLAIWGAWRWGYVVFTLLCLLAVIPFAVASWWLIEKRALSLKRIDFREVWIWAVGPKRGGISEAEGLGVSSSVGGEAEGQQM